MALSEGQIASAKATLEKLTHQELLEVKSIVEEALKKQELVNPTADNDESTKFLLSVIAGESEQAKADQAAVLALTNLAQGTPDTPTADSDAVKRLTRLVDGR